MLDVDESDLFNFYCFVLKTKAWQKCVWEMHVLVFVLTVLRLLLVKMILCLRFKKMFNCLVCWASKKCQTKERMIKRMLR